MEIQSLLRLGILLTVLMLVGSYYVTINNNVAVSSTQGFIINANGVHVELGAAFSCFPKDVLPVDNAHYHGSLPAPKDF